MNIPTAQARLHKAGERLALYVVAPFLAYVALTSPQMERWKRYGIWAIVVGTVLIDGYLLSRWRK